MNFFYQLKLLKHRPRQFWNRLYIRKDEFHKSLDLDLKLMMDLNKEDQKKYLLDLIRRRDIAHRRDLEKINP